MNPTGSDTPAERLTDLLRGMVDREASDLHLIADRSPVVRIHGRLEAAGTDSIPADVVREMLTSVIPARLHEAMLRDGLKDMDFSTNVERDGHDVRFRGNVSQAQGVLSGCFRLIPSEIPTLEWTRFPQDLADRIIRQRNGLVLVTGVAGSGKTTTLAVLVNMLNQLGDCRIVTIEEPIEYVFPPTEGSVVTQREVGVDVDSFSAGLRSALRQDPNVILVGEVRDRDTARMALSAAETGHMVFATLHTRDAKGAVSRLADLFPSDSQDDIRSQLALSLRFIVSQHLLPSAAHGERRELALEVLCATPGVRSSIRLGKLEMIDTALQTGRRDGMIPLDEYLARLVSGGRITQEIALRFANDPQTVGRAGNFKPFANP